MTLKFDGWPWKTIGNIFHVASSFVYRFIAIGKFRLGLQSGNTQFGLKSTIFEPCYLQMWHMTLKNNRTPLLSNIMLCASFHPDMWIETGVIIRKRLNGVLTSVTLTFDLWPWPFLQTSRLSMIITPENFMMIRWEEHSGKSVRDGQTDGTTDRWADRSVLRAACSQLKRRVAEHWMVQISFSSIVIGNNSVSRSIGFLL